MKPRLSPSVVALSCAVMLLSGQRALLAQDKPEAEEPSASEPKQPVAKRIFIGGGVGAAFGTVDYVALAPLVGFHVVPRLDLGVQPFYRWTRDGRYSPSVSTTEYGAGVFARVNIKHGVFGEADYEYSSYEYANGAVSARNTHNAFLAGAGYAVPAGDHVGVYVSALYDFTYDANDPYRAYDSPLRLQVGVAVGF